MVNITLSNSSDSDQTVQAVRLRKNSEKLMKTLDELNQSGKGKVWFAGRGTAPEWQMKREMLSPSYTTQWTEIPIASF
ncbi:DUF4113 domain-containing protein [Escherichia coli]|nr:DUF4113 domain-containing protein [Escherichia coli]EFD5269933.1 DUF4113 domain-containing protein [Escherichia coli]EFH9050137.1 SOS mutagenesis and repair domain protein [Escherichia coli]